MKLPPAPFSLLWPDDARGGAMNVGALQGIAAVGARVPQALERLERRACEEIRSLAQPARPAASGEEALMAALAWDLDLTGSDIAQTLQAAWPDCGRD